MKQPVEMGNISCVNFGATEFTDNLPLLLETVAAFLRNGELVPWEVTIHEEVSFDPDVIKWSARVYVWQPQDT